MADASKKNDLTAEATARDCNVSDLHGFEKEITRMRDLPEYVQEVEFQIKTLLNKGLTDQAAVAIVSMATQLYTADHMNQNVTASMTVKEPTYDTQN